MTVSIGVAIILGVVLLILVLLSDVLGLWGERMRRNTQRERWRKPDDPSRRP